MATLILAAVRHRARVTTYLRRHLRIATSGTGAWSFLPYDDSTWEAQFGQTENLPPNFIKIERIQCIIPSSGMAGAGVAGTTAAIIGGALGAGAGLVVATGLTAATAGVALPVAAGLFALITAETSAAAALIGLAVQKVGTSLGSMFADQTYITFDDEKVWPSETLSI